MKALKRREEKTRGKGMSKAARAIVQTLQAHNDSLRAHNTMIEAQGKAIASLVKSVQLLNTVLMEINGQLKKLGEDEQPQAWPSGYEPKIGGTNGP